MSSTLSAPKKTFMQYLQSLSWEEVINIVMESDPYYNVPALLAEKEKKEKEAATAAAPASRRPSFLARVTGACGTYLRTSSKKRLVVHGLVASYLLYAVYHGHTRPVSCKLGAEVPPSDAASPSVFSSLFAPLRRAVGAAVHRFQLRDFATLERPANGYNLYESSEGMQLVINRALPSKADFHHIFGLVMVPLAMMQKESLFHMSRKYSQPAEGAATTAAAGGKKKDTGKLVRLWRTAHGKCGGIHIMCTVCMCALGFTLGKKLQSSPVYFLKGFIAPFLIFVPMVMAPTKVPNARFFHALTGGIMIQASLAVPLARTLGAQVQRLLQYRLPFPAAGTPGPDSVVQASFARAGELEGCYYFSIGLTTIVVGAWALGDLYDTLTYAHRQYTKSLEQKQKQ